MVYRSAIPRLLRLLIAGIAETHRLPFDLPEGENELGAGFHTEYSGMKFGMFFIGEYAGILVISAMITVLFLGGWQGPFLPPLLWFWSKPLLSSSSSSCCAPPCRGRATTSSWRFGWKVMLPLSLLNIAVTGAVMLAVVHG